MSEVPAPPSGPRWTLQLPLPDLEGTEQLARRLGEVLSAGDLLVLTGGLGAGKTTFTQTLGEALGVQGRISSPTFVLARIHRAVDDGPDLVHVDAYRTDAEGLESLDLPSTAPASVTVVEWGRGLVETALAGSAGSWLDLELMDLELQVLEPTGPAAAHETGEEASSSGGPEIITDFSESEDDLLGAPRRAVLRGYGPRWDEPPVL